MTGKKPPVTRSRGWCFTDFGLDQEKLKGIPCTYLCFGQETCPETKRQHLQGYIYFANAKTFTACQKLLPDIHLEVSKGTAEENVVYCSKEGNFFEQGERPTQGARTDILVVQEQIRNGVCNMRDVLVEATSYQSVRMAEVNLKYFEQPRNWKPRVLWFYGNAGCGKSKAAYEAGGTDPYSHTGETEKWWEGYDAHDVVIIDDYRPEWCSWKRFIQLIDRYPFRVECKGGSRQLRCKTIIITAPVRPEIIWANRHAEDMYQLTRRIDEVRCFSDFAPEYKDPLENYEYPREVIFQSKVNLFSPTSLEPCRVSRETTNPSQKPNA